MFLSNRLAFVAAFTLVAFCPIGNPASVRAAETSELTEGERLYQQGNYKAAIGSLKQELVRVPESAMLHYYLANSYLAISELELATPEYETALKLDPNGSVGKSASKALQELQASAHYGQSSSQGGVTGGGASSGASGAVDSKASGTPDFMVEAAKRIERVNAEADRKISQLNTEMQNAVGQTSFQEYTPRGQVTYTVGNAQAVKDDYQKRISEVRREAKIETDQIQSAANSRLKA